MFILLNYFFKVRCVSGKTWWFNFPILFDVAWWIFHFKQKWFSPGQSEEINTHAFLDNDERLHQYLLISLHEIFEEFTSGFGKEDGWHAGAGICSLAGSDLKLKNQKWSKCPLGITTARTLPTFIKMEDIKTTLAAIQLEIGKIATQKTEILKLQQ